MSKLDELIRELCPEGVQWKKIKEFANCLPGATPKTSCSEYWENGTIPWMSSGEVNQGEVKFTEKKITKKGYDATSTKMVPANTVVIALAGQGKTRGSVAITRISLCTNQSLCAIVTDETVLSEYLFHYMRSQYLKLRDLSAGNGTRGGLNMKMIEAYLVPVPPVEIQSEIVGVLNGFTNLLMELNAELTARKIQYAYYRDKLLQYKMPTKEYEVGEICEVSAGGDVPKEHFSKEKSEQYKVPVISNGCGINAFYGYTDAARVDKPAVTVAARGTIGYAEYRDYPYFPIIRLITLIPRDDEQLNAKYLYYSLEGRHYKVPTSGIPQLTVPVMKKEKVAIPPLDVQNRIVNVLDNFEKICSDLNIGLPAEIEARQKQYEYYRDKLLTFAENGNTILSRAEQSRAEQSRAEQSRAEQSRAEQSRALIKLLQYVFGYAVVSLQDVVKKSCSGGTPKKGVSEYYEGGNIPWLRTQEVVFRDICKTECFITESAVKNSAAKWIPENCVIVAISGATAGRCAINKIPLTTNQHCLNLEIDPEMALYRYVYYCICAKQEELLAKKEGARGDLNSTRILSLQIDLPALEEQKRIVSILDRFDAICNDLTSGLPAEIEARKKQYEYYRDKLLTFKEVAAT